MLRLRALFRNQEGSMFPAMAAIMITMIGMIGTAIDMGRYHMVQSRLSSALDAAGLAVGASNPSDSASVIANQYMSANFPSGYMGATLGTTTVTPNGANTVITLSATATVPTTFLYVLGIDSLTATASSQITKQSSGMELVLVLDNTGSMACLVNGSNCNSGPSSKIQQLKNAVSGTGGLLDILYGGSDTVDNLWVGVVPFTDMVNIGTSHTTWMDDTYDNALDFGPSISGSSCPSYTGATVTHSGSGSSSRCVYTMSGSSQPNFGPNGLWQGCVLARSATTPSSPSMSYDSSDDPPSANTSGTLFQYFLYPTTDTSASTSNTCTSGSNPWTCSRSTTSHGATTTYTTYYAQTSSLGPNNGCIQTPVLPMVASKTTVNSTVNSMTANGATMINLGMAWGWRMLSPNWQGMWGGEMDTNGLPLAYNTPLMNKVLILMTDGENSTGTPSGYQTQTLPSNSTLDTKTLAVCTAMKNNGITIYTIGFGTGSDVNTTLLSSCATDSSHFFLAPTNAELAADFQQIGQALANLRVSQ